LVKWKKLAVHKAQGGWGLKNVLKFSKALAAKNIRRLLQKHGLWCKVVGMKYISPDKIDDWLRKPVKSLQNVSIIWKVVVLAYPLVGDWLV
jgi:hypothetical protein